MHVVRLTDGREFGPATMEVIHDWARQGRIPRDATLVPTDGSPAVAVVEVSSLAVIIHAPPTQSSGITEQQAPLSGLIPYKNPAALVGYYLGIASLIPFLGIAFGPAAIILGIVGLRARMKDPRKRGMAHAWVAIIVGFLGTAMNGLCLSGTVFRNLFN